MIADYPVVRNAEENRLHVEDNWMAVYAAKLRSDLATSEATSDSGHL
jgi:hypothetical protein